MNQSEIASMNRADRNRENELQVTAETRREMRIKTVDLKFGPSLSKFPKDKVGQDFRVCSY